MSSALSFQYHSLVFMADGDANLYDTWDNWHLIPSSRPIVAEATPKLNYVEIPGSNKSLDLTEYLTGIPTYSERKGSFEFYVMDDGTTWAERRKLFANYFNGRKMMMIMTDEPDRYYRGRFYFKGWQSDASGGRPKITIEYQIDPYRYYGDGREADL